jgi:hypothetical protein
MKKLNLLITGLAFIAIFSLAMCSSGSSSDDEKNDSTIGQLEQKMDTLESKNADSLKSKGGNALGKEFTAKYICPEHCKGSGSDKPGKCADCGMDLIENPNQQKK